MAIISNKDLEQFGNILNSLINQIKKNEENINDSNNKAIATIREYGEITLKNQQQFIHGFNLIKNMIEKSSLLKPENFFVELKKDFNTKTDIALEQLKTKVYNNYKKDKRPKTLYLLTACICLLIMLFAIYRFTKSSDTTKHEAVKYKLLLKSFKGITKKNYLRWDSIANKRTLPELEEKLKKTEGK